jgi:hypothetical protein
MTDTLDSYEQVRTRRDQRADRKSDFSIQDIDSAALTKPDRIRLPLVSFIIPNADDKTLDPMLAAISAQDYPRVEAIFITTNSVGTRQEAVRPRNAQFTFLHCAAEDSELARAMAGLQAATGEFITCLGAADLPAAQFASAHIQVHLASCHNVAYTASPRPMIAIEQAVDVDVDGIRSVSESCLRPANASLRLACVDEAMFTRLAAKTSLCPPSPASFSARFNMYRRSVTSLVHPVGEGADLDGLTADAHFGPLCHALGGTAIINMNLMAPARLCDESSKAARMGLQRARVRSPDRKKAILGSDRGNDRIRAGHQRDGSSSGDAHRSHGRSDSTAVDGIWQPAHNPSASGDCSQDCTDTPSPPAIWRTPSSSRSLGVVDWPHPIRAQTREATSEEMPGSPSESHNTALAGTLA